MWSWLLEVISLIGKIPLCNRIPERAPHLFGHSFILCYRCTFILVGLFITLFIIRNKARVSISKVWVLMIPMIIDGGIQALLRIESTNPRRSITGYIFGIAMAFFIKWGWQKIDQDLGLESI